MAKILTPPTRSLAVSVLVSNVKFSCFDQKRSIKVALSFVNTLFEWFLQISFQSDIALQNNQTFHNWTVWDSNQNGAVRCDFDMWLKLFAFSSKIMKICDFWSSGTTYQARNWKWMFQKLWNHHYRMHFGSKKTGSKSLKSADPFDSSCFQKMFQATVPCNIALKENVGIWQKTQYFGYNLRISQIFLLSSLVKHFL